EYADSVLIGQGRHLQRLFFFCHSTARTIANLAYGVGAMKCAVQSICCQLHTIAEAAEGKQQHYSGQIFKTLSGADLNEILCAAREACEALGGAVARAEERERVLTKYGYPTDGGAA